MRDEDAGPSREELDPAKSKLGAADISLSAVSSDLGKINIADAVENHLERARHAIEIAKFFGTEYIRLFSFFIQEGDNPDDHRGEVLSRTCAMVALAEEGASHSFMKTRKASMAIPRSGSGISWSASLPPLPRDL